MDKGLGTRAVQSHEHPKNIQLTNKRFKSDTFWYRVKLNCVKLNYLDISNKGLC
jgi:hypothetical protein